MLPPLVVTMIIAYAIALCLQPQASATSFRTLDWQHAIRKAQKAWDAGDVEGAQRYERIAFEEAKRLGSDHPFYTITLRHLSDTAYNLAKFDTAKKHSLAELEILRQLGANYQDVVPVLLRLGEIAFVNGHIDEAKSYFFEAKRVRDRSAFNPLLKAEIACRLSLLEFVDGNEEQGNALRKTAEEEWIKSVKEQKAGTNMAEYGYELGKLANSMNKRVRRVVRDSAYYFLKRSLQITEKCQGTYGLGYINPLIHLGECYGFNQKFDEEFQCFKKAMNKALESPILRDPEKLATLTAISKILIAQRHFEEALIVLHLELRLSSRDRQNRVFQIDLLTFLAHCNLELKRYDQAIAFKRQLLDIYESMGTKSAVSSLKTEIDILSARIK
ncbi:MAG: hypothetical protein K2X93_15370 [Candidatus Obscuribacterales bacterium]|nr:hypothetical protein [Candidatus Obscuribacterales bacterium]